MPTAHTAATGSGRAWGRTWLSGRLTWATGSIHCLGSWALFQACGWRLGFSGFEGSTSGGAEDSEGAGGWAVGSRWVLAVFGLEGENGAIHTQVAGTQVCDPTGWGPEEGLGWEQWELQR